MTAKVSIGTYAPVKEANPYSDVITALASAGPDAAANIDVSVNDAAKTGRKFADAANDQSFTAKRRVILGADGDGEFTVPLTKDDVAELDGATVIRLVYTLGPKQNRPGRPRKDATAEPVVEVDASVTAPTPAPAKSNGKK